MATKDRYSVSKTCVYNLGYHLIWCTKYRRKVLTPEIESRLKELIREKADALEVEIVEMETMPNHIHIFVKSKPTYAPHFLVQQFKGYPHAYCVRNLQSYAPVCRLYGRGRISASLSDVFLLIP